MPATPDATSTDRFTNRLIFLHGFTQTHHHWHPSAHLLAERLGTHPSLAFIDLPGHGLSTENRLEIATAGPALVELGGPATYIGYSMGGRFGLIAALTDRALVERLVLIGATPGIDDRNERSERHRLDRERADHLEHVGLDAFLDEWVAGPMFADLPTGDSDLEHRRRNSVDGLAHSLRGCGTGVQGSMWDHLARIPVPVLVLAGSRDQKFTAIGRRMAGALPNATFLAIEGAGHAAHTERPVEVATAIASWLDAT